MNRSHFNLICLAFITAIMVSQTSMADDESLLATSPFDELAETYTPLPETSGRVQLQQAFGIESQPGRIKLASNQVYEDQGYYQSQYHQPQYQQQYQSRPTQVAHQQSSSQWHVPHIQHESFDEYVTESCPQDCKRERTIFGGAAVVILEPHFENNIAFTVTDPTVAIAGTVERNREFDYDYDSSQRYWLGIMNDQGFGGRIRYWFFDQNSDRETFVSPAAAITMLTPDLPGALPQTPSGGNVGDSVSAKAELEMYTLDFEMVQRVQRNLWDFDLGGGLRHAAVGQKYQAASTTAGTTSVSKVGHRFDGIGPTVFMELRRPVGGSQLAIVANTRGSLLYGDSKLNARRFTVGGNDFGSIKTRKKEVRGIAELQVGLEWALWMIGDSRCYVQGLWEGQQWFGAGNAVSDSGDMGLTGFSASARLEW